MNSFDLVVVGIWAVFLSLLGTAFYFRRGIPLRKMLLHFVVCSVSLFLLLWLGLLLLELLASWHMLAYDEETESYVNEGVIALLFLLIPPLVIFLSWVKLLKIKKYNVNYIYVLSFSFFIPSCYIAVIGLLSIIYKYRAPSW